MPLLHSGAPDRTVPEHRFALDALSKIHTSLRIFAKHFRCGHQEDAHEFLRYVIDACHNNCLKLIRDRKLRNGAAPAPPGATTNVAYCHDTVVKEIFGRALQREVKCLSCGVESRKTDKMMDISLDVFQSSSMKDALGRFFQPEVLDGSNKYNCDKYGVLEICFHGRRPSLSM